MLRVVQEHQSDTVAAADEQRDETNMVLFVVRIPRAWLEELRRYGRENGQSMAAIGRLALRDFLRPRGPMP